MAQLGWRHHTIIQAVMSRGPLCEDDLFSIFSAISGKDPVRHSEVFHNVLFKINKELAYVQFELRACRNQYDGKVYYGVVNNVADEQSKLGTKYSVPQIAFYKAVIEAISLDVTTQGCITNIEALNVRLENQVQPGQSSEDAQSRTPAAFKTFSMSQKEKTLNDLIQDRWLCPVSNGKVGLGVRSFLDLRSWFRSNNYPSCDVCNEPAVKAAACPNEICTIRIHDYCLKKKFSHRKVARVCPGCSTEWSPTEAGDGEEDADSPEESQMPSSAAAARKRTRSCKAEAVEAHDVQQVQKISADEPRKRLRSCKTEGEGTAETRPSQSSQPSPDFRRTRRSSRIR